MSISTLIDPVSDLGNIRVDGALMRSVSGLCSDMLKGQPDAAYNWDVISLYFTPEDEIYDRKPSYDRIDGMAFLDGWLRYRGMVTSTTVGRALQGLEYIMRTAGVTGNANGLRELEHGLLSEYRRIGVPVN